MPLLVLEILVRLCLPLYLLGRIKGVKRPALAAYLPTQDRGKVLCDVGANPDAKPEHLLQSSIMASNYFYHVEGFSESKSRFN